MCTHKSDGRGACQSGGWEAKENQETGDTELRESSRWNDCRWIVTLRLRGVCRVVNQHLSRGAWGVLGRWGPCAAQT